MSRYRLEPTAEQQVSMVEHCRHARYVWNLAVEQRTHWQRGRPSAPGYNTQARQLTEARADNAWLRAGSHTVQQQALRDFQQAMSHFFNGTHRRPAWRKAGRDEGFRQVGVRSGHIERLNRRTGRVWIPKVGWVRFRWTRAVPAGVKSYRVTLDAAGRWHIAFAAIPGPTDAPGNGATVGVDRGVSVSAATSDGDTWNVPGLSAGERERLLRLQRKLARATPGSNRRKRVKGDIARLKARAADRRKDWVEKTSTELACSYDTIRVEDLNVPGMTRSAKGTVEQPGSHVRQKAGLNRDILSSGWGLLVQRLEHKAPGRVQKIKAAYTSQTCAECGYCAPGNRESQAVFLCQACGHADNADVNAARVIAAGRAVTAHGDLQSLDGSVNCEAAENRKEVPIPYAASAARGIPIVHDGEHVNFSARGSTHTEA